MKYQPPALGRKILQWFCAVEFLEEIEGDLDEQFYERLGSHGLRHAQFHYFIDVFQTFRPYPQKRNNMNKTATISTRDQLNHFFKVTFRNMKQGRSTTFINLFGLAVSLTSFLLIAAYLLDEATFDAFHPHAENVYRISHTYKRYGDGIEETDVRSAGLWSLALKESLPAVKHVTRFSRFGYPGSVRFEKGDKVFVEQEFFWVDSNYTEIFSLPLVSGGDAERILSNPQYVIINERMADKYFGKKDPVGQSLIYSRGGMDFSFIVGAVMKNYPANSHFHPNFIANNQALNPLWKRDGADRVNSWGDAFTYSYVELENGTDPEVISIGLKQIFHKHLGEAAASVWPKVDKLTDLHFTKGMVMQLEDPGDRSNLYIFGSIGALILLMASINYMNLATARSTRRSKEVGLRKTLGVSKGTLVLQFIGESIVMTFIAIILSLLLLIILLPFFNEITGKDFSVLFLLKGKVFIALLAIALVMGILSGSYPAFYLSSFKPVDVLKGKFLQGGRTETFRKTLVVVQFSITLLLLVGTLVIQRQLSFINGTKLSEYKDQVLAVRLFGIADLGKFETFKQLAVKNSFVGEISYGTQVPRQENFGWIDTRVKATGLSAEPYTWQRIDMDFAFPAMFGLEFLAGRNFTVQNPADTGAVVINESSLHDLNISAEKALGLILENVDMPGKKTVIGVVKDFNYYSVRTKIMPLMITGVPANAETMYIRLESNNYPGAIESLTRLWKQVYPATPFQYWFLDEEFSRMYKQELQYGTLLKYFSGLAVLIGCLGLFGLAAFTAEQKTKEIGIRKVLGSSSGQILLMLTSRFVKLVLISFCLGMPLAYVAMNAWLENFVYKVDIGWTLFIAAGSVVMLLTCLTVGIESLRASLANPIDSIRHE